MAKRIALFTFLALLGFVVGTQLETSSPNRRLVVGWNLAAARWTPQSQHLGGVGRESDGSWYAAIWNEKGDYVCRTDGVPAAPGPYPKLAWSPDGTTLAVAAGTDVRLLCTDGRVLRLRAAPVVREIQYSGDTLMARTNNTVFIWKDKANKPWTISLEHLLLSTVDPTGTLLAVNCYQDGIRIFHLRTKRQIQHLEPGRTATGLQFSKGGEHLTFGLRQGRKRNHDKVLTYNLARNRYLGEPLSAPILRGLEVTPDGRNLLVSKEQATSVHLTDDGKEQARRDHTPRLLDRIAPSGKWVLSVPAKPNRAILWRAGAKKEFQLSDKPPTDISFSSDREAVVVSGGVAAVWELPGR